MKTQYYQCNTCKHITDIDGLCTKCGSAGFKDLTVEEVKEVENKLAQELTDIEAMLIQNGDL